MRYNELFGSEKEGFYILDKQNRKRIARYKICEFCGKEFIVEERALLRGQGRFCSNECSSRSRRIRVEVQCDVCGKTFERTNKHLKNSKKTGFHFCSRKCKGIAQSFYGPEELSLVRPDHYDTGATSYRKRAFDSYGRKCIVCGYDEYERVLDVHHIDGNRDNGDIHNLIVLCPIHHAMVTRGLATISENREFALI